MTMKSFTDMELPDMTDAYRQVQEKNLDPVNPVAVKKKFKDRKDKDVDNDGDVDSSDKYLHKKRKAISKAMKEHHQKDENGKVIEHDVEDVEEAMIVTNADKKGNTPAYQNYKKGMKSKVTGKPLYKAADHMKEDLLASGVFSEHEVTKLIWSEFDSEIEENYRAMRNPEKYKDPDESDKPYHKRSREARMRDPERGINSPAFKKFMADRGM